MMTREEVLAKLQQSGIKSDFLQTCEKFARESGCVIKQKFEPKFKPNDSNNDSNFASFWGVAIVPDDEGLLYFCITNATAAEVEQWEEEIDAEYC